MDIKEQMSGVLQVHAQSTLSPRSFLILLFNQIVVVLLSPFRNNHYVLL